MNELVMLAALIFIVERSSSASRWSPSFASGSERFSGHFRVTMKLEWMTCVGLVLATRLQITWMADNRSFGGLDLSCANTVMGTEKRQLVAGDLWILNLLFASAR